MGHTGGVDIQLGGQNNRRIKVSEILFEVAHTKKRSLILVTFIRLFLQGHLIPTAKGVKKFCIAKIKC
jgi:hypothetical protein